MTYNEQTKNNQGHEMGHNKHDGDRSMIFEQPDNPDRCPVPTYELCTSKPTNESNDFFQTPNHNFTNPKFDKWYKKKLLLELVLLVVSWQQFHPMLISVKDTQITK